MKIKKLEPYTEPFLENFLGGGVLSLHVSTKTGVADDRWAWQINFCVRLLSQNQRNWNGKLAEVKDEAQRRWREYTDST